MLPLSKFSQSGNNSQLQTTAGTHKTCYYQGQILLTPKYLYSSKLFCLSKKSQSLPQDPHAVTSYLVISVERINLTPMKKKQRCNIKFSSVFNKIRCQLQSLVSDMPVFTVSNAINLMQNKDLSKLSAT